VYAEISVSPRKIDIEQFEIDYSETPFVPVVLFDSGSSEVDDYYAPVMKELADRLSENGDAILEIRGYYHPQGDGVSGSVRLAKQRAESVRAKLVEFNSAIQKRIIVEHTPVPTRCIRGDIGSMNPKIQQENRRVEISVRTKEEFKLIFENNTPDEIITQLKETGKLYLLERLLDDNPLFFALIIFPNSEQDLHNLVEIRNELRDKLKNQISRKRIFIGLKESVHRDNVEISVCPKWVIHKSIFQNKITGKIDKNIVKISADDETGIRVFRQDGYPIADVVSHWQLSPIPEPTREYYVSGIIPNSSPGTIRRWSKGIKFGYGMKPKSLSAKMILSNYTIDQLTLSDTPDSYANRDMIANYIGSLATHNKKRTIRITIAGYTDHTGDEKKNIQMSEFWAKKEFDYIKRLIPLYLNSKTEWEEQNGITKYGNLEFTVLGKGTADENHSISEETGYGRIQKRRVELQIEIK